MPPSILCAQECTKGTGTPGQRLEPGIAWALCSTPNLLMATKGPHFPVGSTGPNPRPVFTGTKVGLSHPDLFPFTLPLKRGCVQPQATRSSGTAKPPPGVSSKGLAMSPGRKGGKGCLFAMGWPTHCQLLLPAAAAHTIGPFLSPSLPALSSCCCFCESQRCNLGGAAGR